MTDMAARPTTEVRDVILTSMDRMFGQLMERLDGITDVEYLWEAVPDSWSVRSNDGIAVADGAGNRDIDPAPVTTIAWRMWHIAIDCLDDYTRRFNGDDSTATAVWTLDSREAISILHAKWNAYRELIAGREWWQELGDDWESWSQSCVADMAMHASNEIVHHAAEIALLRDLYDRR